jgi:hypothetical protein
MADDITAERVHGFFQAAASANQILGHGQQIGSGFAQENPASLTVKKRHAQIPFECLNALGDSGLTEMKPLSGSRKILYSCCGDEYF